MNFSTEPDLDELIALVSKLPGLGPKSSRRIAILLEDFGPRPGNFETKAISSSRSGSVEKFI